MQIYESQFLEEHFYFNKCHCNEFAALIGRHMIVPPSGLDPIFINREGTKIIDDLINVLGTVEDHSSMKYLFENTRKNILKRYQNAHSNIVNRRLVKEEIKSTAQAFVKYEKFAISKFEKNKPPRLIQFRSYEYLLTVKRFALMHSKNLMNNNGYYRGQKISTTFMKYYKPSEQCSILKEHWDQFENPIALCYDMKAFDGHYNHLLLSLEHQFYSKRFSLNYLSKILDKQLDNSVYSHEGIKWKIKGSRLSGEFTTSDGNSLLNFIMLRIYMSNIKSYIFVNGDDSIIMLDNEDMIKLKDLSFFEKFGMECECDRIVNTFEKISFCQSSPVLIDGKYRFVKEWYRTMSRCTVAPSKYEKCIKRYLAGIGLCELASNVGVPILQAWSIKLLSDSDLVKPLGCVDKIPAKNINSESLEIKNITLENRLSFSQAFDISVEEQLYIEEIILAGQSIRPPALQTYLIKYKNFHLN
jgi:hypothetical protein